MKVKKEIWIPSPKKGVTASGSANYLSAKNLRMMQIYNYVSSSDRADAIYQRFSNDNGKTWDQPELLHTYDKKGDYTIRYGVGIPFVDTDHNVLVRFRGTRFLKHDDVLSGQKRFKMFYQISKDEGKTFTAPIQIIEEGDEFNSEHYMSGVFYGKNCAQIEGVPIKVSPREILVPLCLFPIDEKGKLYNPRGAYTFAHIIFLVGEWNEDLSKIKWKTSQVVKISPDLSTRGLNEPAVAILPDGKLFCICRGSNDKAPHIPGYKWVIISSDKGKTWSKPSPLCYDNGEKLFSPASYSRLIRHFNGRLYWIANIVSANPYANSPRYPLTIAEIDEENLTLRRQSIFVIDTRGKDESEFLQLSNFGVYEDRKTKEIIITLSRLFPEQKDDWTASCMKYSINVS